MTHLQIAENNGDLIIVNATLPHEAWIKWKDAMLATAKQTSNILNYLIGKGLFSNDYSMADTIAKWQVVSEVSKGSISMDGLSKGPLDRTTYTTKGVPIPMFKQEWEFSARQLASLKTKPNALNQVIEEQMYQLNLMLANMCVEGVPGLVVDGMTMYGLVNHPQRNTVSISPAWGTEGATPITDILEMRQKLIDDHFYGPYTLCLPRGLSDILDEDYSTLKGDKTLRERIQEIDGIEDIVMVDQLSAGHIVLFEASTRAVEVVSAVPPTIYPQPLVNNRFAGYEALAVMSIMVKADAKGQCGVCHATGAE